jgi:preprotein translocase subunit SecG
MKKEIIYILQILVSSILIFLILIQKRGSALTSGEFYPLRRGLEKKIFFLTIFFIAVFVGLALINLIVK